ncbi:lanthionine synthetase LanC family protein [Ligilactobacillus faecis]|uniref:Lanthionine synthetase LanC family protein n=1 Tax=Ligilactobacillus faecis TaxID=762833 RepID=A0ABV4DNY3_9LACO
MDPINNFHKYCNYQGWKSYTYYELPYQGWKIHVSAMHQNYQTILNHVAFLAERYKFSYKFASDELLIRELLGVHSNRISGGKLITIYPKSEKHRLEVMELLYKYLRYFSGPTVLSDRQFRGTSNISYRYGAFKNRGDSLVILDNLGNEYEDKRLPYFYLPPFIEDPFRMFVARNKDLSNNWSKLKIEKAVQFNFGGGVYKGTYFDVGAVVVKEARFGVGTGTDIAIKKRQNECAILKRLHSLYVPEIVSEFFSQNNYYLVMKEVKAKTFYDYAVSNGPVVVGNFKREEALSNFLEIIQNIAKMINFAHERGIILRDISPTNIMVNDKNKKVYFVDCADSIFYGDKCREHIITPHYEIPHHKYNTYDEDWFKFGLLIMDGLGAVNRNHCIASFQQIQFLFSKVLEYQGFSEEWGKVVEELFSGGPSKTLDDKQLSKLKKKGRCKNSDIYELKISKLEISDYLYDSLSSKDKKVFDKIHEVSLKSRKLLTKKLLDELIFEQEMVYRVSNVYSPYMYNGSAGIMYILLNYYDEYADCELLPSLVKYLDKFDGRYVKNATLSHGAAGIGMMLIYAYLVVGKKEYLKKASEWDEVVEVLSFVSHSRKCWANSNFDSKFDKSVTNGIGGIRLFQKVLRGN